MEGGKAVNSLIIEDYTTHMGQGDLGDRMVNKYSNSKKTWKRTRKLLFHSSDLNFQNSFILYKSSRG
jgi:hypothetical protein